MPLSGNMSKNKLIIAAAGSGKTTHLVQEALKIKEKNVLITTYTDANEEEIKKKFADKNRVIPDNVTIQTWFSFLIQHGVKPYRSNIFEEPINGLHFVEDRSAKGIPEADTKNFYFDSNNKIYSDKISHFTIKCNTEHNGKVINRIVRIYQHIFIDEIQDLSGWDLEFLKLLFDSSCKVTLVGDPRQGTYSTSNAAKNNKFAKCNIVKYFDSNQLQDKLEIDRNSFITNYRSNQKICDFANKIFTAPEYNPTNSKQNKTTGHDGVFLIRKIDIDAYLFEHPYCVQLRYNIREQSVKNYCDVCNFGNSKGRSYDRVLIYPTKPITKWIKDNDSDLKPESRSKFYVAVTRARYSVGIVYDYKDDEVINGTEKYKPNV